MTLLFSGMNGYVKLYAAPSTKNMGYMSTLLSRQWLVKHFSIDAAMLEGISSEDIAVKLKGCFVDALLTASEFEGRPCTIPTLAWKSLTS